MILPNILKEKKFEDMKIGDVVYFEEWWSVKDVFAIVIEIDFGISTYFFRLWFPDVELEKQNQEDTEWFAIKHIDKLYELQKGK